MSARRLTQTEALVLADYYRKLADHHHARARELAKAAHASSPAEPEHRQARAMEAHCDALRREWLDYAETLTEESV